MGTAMNSGGTIRPGLWVIVALAVASGHAPAQSRGLIGFVDELTLSRQGMTRKWYVQVPMLRVRERVLSIKQQEDLLFVATDKGFLHCLNAETGQILWTQSVSEAGGNVFPPALTGRYIFVTSGTRMTQLDRRSGGIVQTKDLDSAATSGPGANDEYCYVQTVDNRISAIQLSPSPDEALRKWPFKRKFTLPAVKWFFDAGSPLDNPPIVLPDRVLFTSANGVVFASVLDERSIFYRYIPGAPIAAPVSFRGKALYVATVDYNLFAVNVFTGETIWRFASGYPIYRQPVPFAGDVYLTPEGGGLFALDNADGSLRWVNESATRVVAASQSRLYAMNNTLRFLILDRKDGAMLGGWPAYDFPISAYNQTSDRVYLATKDGLILCLAEIANKAPYLHDAPQAVKAPAEPAVPDMPEGDAPADDEMEGPSDDTNEEMEAPETPQEEEMQAPGESPDEEMEAPEPEASSVSLVRPLPIRLPHPDYSIGSNPAQGSSSGGAASSKPHRRLDSAVESSDCAVTASGGTLASAIVMTDSLGSGRVVGGRNRISPV